MTLLRLHNFVRANENKMSDGYRERTSAAVEACESCKARTRGLWPFAPSPG